MVSSVLSACTAGAAGLGFWYIKRVLDRQERKRDTKDKLRIQYEVLSLRLLTACLDFDGAVSIAVESGKCNGELKAARQREKDLRAEVDEFMSSQALNQIM